MSNTELRERGLQRLKASDFSIKNPHYIVNTFLGRDINWAASKYAGGSLLDVGCGNKPYKPVFESKVQSYRGCDIVQSSENVVDDICPANKLPYENSAFDTVFSTQVMEHVEDFQGMIIEMYRVLRPGGFGIVTVPFCWELHEEPYDFHRFSKYGLKYDFENAGFQVVEIKENGGKWATLFQIGLNVLFSTRKYKTLRSRCIKFLFIHLRFLYLYNRLGVWLDKRYFDPLLTLNYIVIVTKQKD